MSEKQEPGRPSGKPYPHVRSVRFSDRDIERLRRLAGKMERREVDVIREALRRMAQAEGVDDGADR